MTAGTPGRRVALVTGVGRRVGIGAAVAERLALDGFDVGLTFWSDYDERMAWGRDVGGIDDIVARITDEGARSTTIEADLTHVDAPAAIFDDVEAVLGTVTALVMCHCESVDSNILKTTIESFDRHVAVNARASWLLVAEFGRRFRSAPGEGRIVSLTSDHTVGNLPYGATKAALDRITLAAAHEFAHLGVTANVINPGATDTGWMTPEIVDQVRRSTPLGRVGQPADAANLVSFLCSPEGGWINGQLLHSNGGA